jgi:hypothetical protein
MWMLEDVQDCNGAGGRIREDTPRAAGTSTLADGHDGATGAIGTRSAVRPMTARRTTWDAGRE